jgi:cell division cycle 20, cofactor of APC complex
MRRVSSASLASSSQTAPTYPECSAKHHLRNTKLTIDFSTPPAPVADPLPELAVAASAPLLSCSAMNVLFFSRGNRVHYKNMMATTEDVGQLCKLQDSHGDLRIIECGGVDQPDVVALATSKGLVQIWDVKAKKMTASWSTKGTIKHYDTRVATTSKMKEQARKVTRHQSRITSLEWNVDGKILASGDQSGTVYCWDMKEKVPLDVGEFIQRRKKMQHGGAISVSLSFTCSFPPFSTIGANDASQALAWCPWQPKLLASADVQGTIRLWTVNAASTHSNATTPGKLELNAPITGLHFSPHCKELLSTHGALPDAEGSNSTAPPNTISRPKMGFANSIAVHSYPSLRHVTTLNMVDKPIGCSVLSASGTRLVMTVPEEGKVNVCDVWSKRKEVKRQPSFFGSTIR